MIQSITKPTLVIDKAKCLNNIKRMSDKAKRSAVKFRPHFKTHQSAEIGNWFKDFGVKSITVSSVSMAKYFSQNGWNDITIAFPVNILEINEINELAWTGRDPSLQINLLVISRETLTFLNKNLKSKTGIFIKINTGYNRTGIVAEDTNELDKITDDLRNSKMMIFKGFLTHAGHTYNAQSKEEVIKIHEETKQQLLDLKKRYISVFEKIEISVGDTPSCSIATDFTDLDEIRPGNFIYYDVMQYNIGSCKMDNIAAAVACPIVGKDRSKNEIFIYGGAIHLSTEYLLFEEGLKHYGLIVRFNGNKRTGPIPNTYVARLSQEHGIIKTTPEHFDSFNVGDIIGVLPVHSCLTANLMRGNYMISDE